MNYKADIKNLGISIELDVNAYKKAKEIRVENLEGQFLYNAKVIEIDKDVTLIINKKKFDNQY